MVSNRLDSRVSVSSHGCLIKDRLQFAQRKTDVVYGLSMSCGRVYVGQTGRCLNVSKGAHHCAGCGCEPCFTDTQALSKHRDRATRERAKAFHIRIRGSQCIIHPSRGILDKEVLLLKEKKRRGRGCPHVRHVRWTHVPACWV